MSKKNTTASASQPSATPPPRRVLRGSRTHEEIAHELAARIDLVPEYVDVFDLEESRALVAAFSAHQVEEDTPNRDARV